MWADQRCLSIYAHFTQRPFHGYNMKQWAFPVSHCLLLYRCEVHWYSSYSDTTGAIFYLRALTCIRPSLPAALCLVAGLRKVLVRRIAALMVSESLVCHPRSQRWRFEQGVVTRQCSIDEVIVFSFCEKDLNRTAQWKYLFSLKISYDNYVYCLCYKIKYLNWIWIQFFHH